MKKYIKSIVLIAIGVVVGVIISVTMIVMIRPDVKQVYQVETHTANVVDAILLAELKNKELEDIKRFIIENELVDLVFEANTSYEKIQISKLVNQVKRYYEVKKAPIPPDVKKWIDLHTY